MKINKNAAVTLQFNVTDMQGKLVEDGKEPSVYLHGGYGNTLPKIEAALEGQEAGYQVKLTLQPEEAFGAYDDTLLRSLPKKRFPPGVKVGGQLEGRDDDGKMMVFNVMKIKGDTVLLDANHPLAGKTLVFSIKVLAVRQATGEEIAHQHVHGEHGHQH